MKFNTLLKRAAAGNTTNLAGGRAFIQSTKEELVSILLTATLGDTFYRSGDATVARVKELVAATADKRFVAKAAIYARTKAGMRSVSHLVAAELAASVKGEPWTKTFCERVVHRPDDALEILACYLAAGDRPIPNALKKGLGAALARFDEYQLANYRRESAEIKLVDAVNLLHPPHSEPLRKLVRGELAPAETWETKLTQAGARGETDGEVAELKGAAWDELIASRKLGYFALLRNLRNILEQAPQSVDAALAMLVDDRLIAKSLVLPFRYLTALDAVQASNLPRASQALAAINDAVDKALANVPRFAGRTLIALDCSGSMAGRPLQIGSLFAAVLAKANRKADVMLFSDDAKFITVNLRDSTLTLAREIASRAAPAGTNFHAIFQRAKAAYDRIVILSDMQGWIGHNAPVKTFADYKRRTGSDPRVFSFDLAGYGTLQFPERHVYCLAGFSDKALQTMSFLEEDKGALLREIEAIEL
ncbi:MAG TPA: TROVE domain-containing protein [Chthoniobacterales bacterium]